MIADRADRNEIPFPWIFRLLGFSNEDFSNFVNSVDGDGDGMVWIDGSVYV